MRLELKYCHGTGFETNYRIQSSTGSNWYFDSIDFEATFFFPAKTELYLDAT